jgi:hypothetical protein
MLPGRVTATGEPRGDQRPGPAAAVPDERRGPKTPRSSPCATRSPSSSDSCRVRRRGSPELIGPSSPLCSTACRATCYGESGCSCAPMVHRWHRDLIARRHARISRPKRAGRPPTIRSIRALALRLARENSSWGYRRIHGELLVLGVKVAPSTVWEILKDAGIDPVPESGPRTAGAPSCVRRPRPSWPPTSSKRSH